MSDVEYVAIEKQLLDSLLKRLTDLEQKVNYLEKLEKRFDKLEDTVEDTEKWCDIIRDHLKLY